MDKSIYMKTDGIHSPRFKPWAMRGRKWINPFQTD